jgi:uncharacterized protein
LSKEEIRALSRRAGLPTWDLPASPCLASRIQYGLPVTQGRLRQIESAEAGLRTLAQWQALRVRHHGDFVRVEVDREDLWRFVDAAFRARAIRILKDAGFARACLDLSGYRRGALNEPVESGELAESGEARR